MKIAVFDVDQTLLKRDSLFIAIQESQGIFNIFIRSFICLIWFVKWKVKIIRTKQFKEKILSVFSVCEKFNQEESIGQYKWLLPFLLKAIRPEALSRINYHKSRGDLVVLCSASTNMILLPLADYLDVDLICTELHRENNKWYPMIKGRNCKGQEKVDKLIKKYGPLKSMEIEAYGNRDGDKELLQLADYPHYMSFKNEPKDYPDFSLLSSLPIIAIAFLLYAFFYFKLDYINTFNLVENAYIKIPFCLLLVSIGYFLRFIRWRIILQCFGISIPFLVDARVWMGSYAFTATPGKTGELVRSYILNRKYNISFSDSFISLLLERLFDALAVVLFVMIWAPKYFEQFINIHPFYMLILPIILICFIRLNVHKIFISQVINKFISKKSFLKVDEFYCAIKSLFKLRAFLLVISLSAFAWLCEGLSFWLLLIGMDVEGLGVGGATLAHTFSGLIGAISMLPGGLGTTEASTVTMLAVKGVPIDMATSATLLIRLFTLWFATLLGTVCLVCSKDLLIRKKSS
tara:strand:- start:7759 stop:9312 length:1554 start_codon:yes stop_codon:yes gene_type:complete